MRQEGRQGQSGLHTEFEVSLEYTASTCQGKKEREEKKREGRGERENYWVNKILLNYLPPGYRLIKSEGWSFLIQVVIVNVTGKNRPVPCVP